MPTPIDAANLLTRHPNPTFDKIAGFGYVVEYWFEEHTEIGRDLVIQVRCDGEVIAGADYTEDRGVCRHRVQPERERE
jgi:hypothetical protein